MDHVRTPAHDPGTLHEAEARFRIAFEEAGISMAIVGLDGSFLRVNRALSELLGHSAEALLDGGMALVAPRRRRADLRQLAPALRAARSSATASTVPTGTPTAG